MYVNIKSRTYNNIYIVYFMDISYTYIKNRRNGKLENDNLFSRRKCFSFIFLLTLSSIICCFFI